MSDIQNHHQENDKYGLRSFNRLCELDKKFFGRLYLALAIMSTVSVGGVYMSLSSRIFNVIIGAISINVVRFYLPMYQRRPIVWALALICSLSIGILLPATLYLMTEVDISKLEAAKLLFSVALAFACFSVSATFSNTHSTLYLGGITGSMLIFYFLKPFFDSSEDNSSLILYYILLPTFGFGFHFVFVLPSVEDCELDGIIVNAIEIIAAVYVSRDKFGMQHKPTLEDIAHRPYRQEKNH